MLRLGVHVVGTVQGVGFRPFVYGAAQARGLTGWVCNDTDGVHLEVQGHTAAVHAFLETLRREPPPAARIAEIAVRNLKPAPEEGFHIRESLASAPPMPCLPTDLAICAACAAEIVNSGNRRHRYPFTNCTLCGPRYSLIESLPYDRPRTSMRDYVLCPDCRAEYENPSDRRFHAQPICCPQCGPELSLVSPSGEILAVQHAALKTAAARLLDGEIVACKGLGGFHLLTLATDAAAVLRLRRRKKRHEKPLAVMFESLAAVRRACIVSETESTLLASAAAPIVLLRHRADSDANLAASAIAPGNPFVGVLLPYTPLHQLLLSLVQKSLICTSGNLSEEPICTDGAEARVRLHDVADVFLDHDRPIVRPVDDSVVRTVEEAPLILRRARGFAPLPLPLPGLEGCVLATGAHLKSTITLLIAEQAIVSQHLGDLSAIEGVALLERTASDLLHFFAAKPQAITCDRHPDYASTRLAERLASEWSVPLLPVQHHHAHIAAVIAEHRIAGPVLGLAWDGAGLGLDDTLWGGEALIVEGDRFERLGHLRAFRLPGGERALREPRRAALGALFEIFRSEAGMYLGDLFPANQLRSLLGMLEQGLYAPWTTSIGRLFDVVAVLTDLRTQTSFEGQAAMSVEFAAEHVVADDSYPIPISSDRPFIADWEPMLRQMLIDRNSEVPVPLIAARFHEALAQLAEAWARRVGLPQVVLSGGCFQNARLLGRVRARLLSRGFKVYTPRMFPPNDGGISLGQAYIAAQILKRS